MNYAAFVFVVFESERQRRAESDRGELPGHIAQKSEPEKPSEICRCIPQVSSRKHCCNKMTFG